jgi:capsular exopolysaccharide synthesis family protein
MENLNMNARSKPDMTIDTGLNIDPKRILYHLIKYWYIVVLALLITCSIAFLRNRYATKVFPVAASILIKETEENAEGKYLYNNPLVSFYRNYLNELYIIKSYPLIQKTIEDLEFESTFYLEGSVLTTEAYRSLPFKVKVVSDMTPNTGQKYYFEAIDKSKFQISYLDSESQNPFVFHYGDTANIDGFRFVLTLKQPVGEEHLGKRIIFSYTPAAKLADIYVKRLNVAWAEEGSGVVNLSVNGSIPSKEIDFLNGLIHQYQQYNFNKKVQAASRTIDFIAQQIADIQDSLKIAERQLELFKTENVFTDLSAESFRLFEKVEKFESEKAELVIKSNYYDYLEKYISNDMNLDQVILPSSIGVNDNVLSSLVTVMINTQLEMKSLTSSKLENPIFVERQRRIHEIKRDIMESVSNQRAVDKIRLNFLNKSIADVDQRLSSLPLAERQYIAIKRNYTLLESLYIFLLQKKAEAGISKAATTADVVMVNPPLAGNFISPRPVLNYLIAISTGLAIPLIFFLSMEFFNNKVQSREDIEKVSSIPFLGGTGHKKDGDNLVVVGHPKSAIAESFRALRSNLGFFLQSNEPSVILVTSSISGEGKTFTSINLASVFALTGKRTLIIGADMRKPRIFEDFGLSNEHGLSTYLAGLVSFESVVQSTQFENLFLISGGPVPPNPSELMLTVRMEELIRNARAHFDMVIIDSPPLAIVADALSLINYADHTIFLVRQDYTPKVLLKTMQDLYESGKLTKVSVVLNDIYRSGLGYGYGYGYGYNYGYGNSTNKNGGGYYYE